MRSPRTRHFRSVILALTAFMVAFTGLGTPAHAALDGSPSKGCSLQLPAGAKNLVEQRWQVPPIASLPSPSRVTMCKFDLGGIAYTLIVGRYAKESVAKGAIASLYRTDRMMYLGIPSTFVAASKKSATGATPIAGSVSSDDCGMYDGELFDTGCPQGKAATMRTGTSVWVLANRFEMNRAQLRAAPTAELARIVSANNLPVSIR